MGLSVQVSLLQNETGVLLTAGAPTHAGLGRKITYAGQAWLSAAVS